MSKGSFFIVIPAYNEGDIVSSVVADAVAAFPRAHIVVVDDGSADGTAKSARKAGATVISHVFNMGYGAAIHTGLSFAYRAGASFVLTMDADGQHEAGEAMKLFGPVERGDADVALGSRFLPGSESYKVPRIRRAGSAVFATVASFLLRQKITDPTTGFQCLNRKALRFYVEVPEFPELYPDADMILFAALLGCRIFEVPVRMNPRAGGKSMHGTLKSMFYVPHMLLSMLGILVGKNLLRRGLLYDKH